MKSQEAVVYCACRRHHHHIKTPVSTRARIDLLRDEAFRPNEELEVNVEEGPNDFSFQLLRGEQKSDNKRDWLIEIMAKTGGFHRNGKHPE